VDSHAIVVIGIGSVFRSDDGLGLFVAEQIDKLGLAGVKVVDGVGDGYALIDSWAGAETAFVIDCAYAGGEPATIYRFDALRESIPADLFLGLSTHSISITDAVALAEVMNRLPRRLIVYGIEGENFEAGTRITPCVKHRAMEVVDRITREIGALAGFNAKEGHRA